MDNSIKKQSNIGKVSHKVGIANSDEVKALINADFIEIHNKGSQAN